MTIKDIAKEANVSAGTVDRVIHNRPGVSLKTKEKVQRLLEKHGFERNVLASTLAYKRKYHIAVLIPAHQSNNEFWYEPNRGIKSVQNELKKYGVEIHLFHFNKVDSDSFKQSLQDILDLNPDGIVLAPFFHNISLEFAQELSKRKIPFIFINLDIESQDNLTFIGQDSYKGGLMAGKLLDLLLCRKAKVAVIKSANIDNHHAIDARVRGFEDYWRQQGNDIRELREIYLDEFSRIETNRVLNKEFQLDNPIKGIFVPSSLSHIVAKYLEDNNLQHIQMVGFDALAENLKHLKSGTIDFLIDQDPFEQGYLGVKLMFEYLLFKKPPRKLYPSAINIVTQENADFFRNLKVAEVIS
jgi:LacI family transcriptional regulator